MYYQTVTFFEKCYPYSHNLSIASIENCEPLIKMYKLNRFFQIKPNKPMPFPDANFDIVTAWATLEHVGSRTAQKTFIQEISRIGKKVFITIPDRASFYEPHTGLPFLHWLPLPFFRKVLRFMGKRFWAEENNWNPLTIDDVKQLLNGTDLCCMQVKQLHYLPGHIVIYRN